jgi:hypothetical protein
MEKLRPGQVKNWVRDAMLASEYADKFIDFIISIPSHAGYSVEGISFSSAAGDERVLARATVLYRKYLITRRLKNTDADTPIMVLSLQELIAEGRMAPPIWEVTINKDASCIGSDISLNLQFVDESEDTDKARFKVLIEILSKIIQSYPATVEI